MRVTIKDVAREVGVSTSTVSRVMSGTGGVSEEKAKRVTEAVSRLGYRTSSLGRSLRTNKTYTLGLVIPDITNPFFPQLAKGVDDAAHREGYNIFLCNTEGDIDREKNYIDLLCQRRADGIILDVTDEDHARAYLQSLKEEDIPVVIVDREVRGASVDTVLINNEDGGYRVTKYLLCLGHRRVGIVAGPATFTFSNNRLTGVWKALKEAGLDPDSDLVQHVEFSLESGFEATERLLALTPRPTAIFAFSDVMALGVLAAVERFGLRVPEDLSVIGFDNTRVSSLVKPPLTTVAQPFYKMGLVAVKLVLKRLRRKAPRDGRHRRVVLPAEMVCRASAGRLDGQEVHKCSTG